MRSRSKDRAILWTSTDDGVSGTGQDETGCEGGTHLHDRTRQAKRLGALRRGRHVFNVLDGEGRGGGLVGE